MRCFRASSSNSRTSSAFCTGCSPKFSTQVWQVSSLWRIANSVPFAAAADVDDASLEAEEDDWRWFGTLPRRPRPRCCVEVRLMELLGGLKEQAREGKEQQREKEESEHKKRLERIKHRMKGWFDRWMDRPNERMNRRMNDNTISWLRT